MSNTSKKSKLEQVIDANYIPFTLEQLEFLERFVNMANAHGAQINDAEVKAFFDAEREKHNRRSEMLETEAERIKAKLKQNSLGEKIIQCEDYDAVVNCVREMRENDDDFDKQVVQMKHLMMAVEHPDAGIPLPSSPSHNTTEFEQTHKEHVNEIKKFKAITNTLVDTPTVNVHAHQTSELTDVVSERIRQRIIQSGDSFTAIDNISKHILEGELDELINEVADKFEGALRSLIIDIENDPNSNGTGRRMAKMYINEIMSGRYLKAPSVTAFPNENNRYDQLIFTRTDIKSMCSHHHQPVTGVCYIACLPGDKVIGLSKYSRIAQHLARRGTLQEELTVLIADEIEKQTGSNAVGVHIRARHGCCENRGIMSSNSNTQTTVVRGDMKTDKALKEEFMNNIQFSEMNNKGI